MSFTAILRTAFLILISATAVFSTPFRPDRLPEPKRVQSRVLAPNIVVADRSETARELWSPPLGAPLVVSGPYQPPPTPYAAGHRGIDIPGKPGESALAPVAGTVSFVGKVADRYVLTIRIDARTVVTLEPLEQGKSALAEGDSVGQGQIVGETGEGGHCLAECLHLGVRVNDEYVNPLRYFFGRPVLLPW